MRRFFVVVNHPRKTAESSSKYAESPLRSVRKRELKKLPLYIKQSTNNLLERGDHAVIFKRGVQSSTRARKSQVSTRYTNYFKMDLPA